MDRQPLQDSAGRSSEEVRISGRSSTDPSMRGPPGATDNTRRLSTTDRESRNLTISDEIDIMNDESFNFQAARSYSWESQSDGEDRGGVNRGGAAGRRDQRKFDMTTPTLIDEIDDEEMISLQRARARQEERGLVIRDESSLRRTPGASMYKSGIPQEEQVQMRRTPGAHDMHRSMEGTPVIPHHQHQHQHHLNEQTDESAVLGFGLTLSTPVATGNRTRTEQGETWERAPSTASSPRINQSTAESLGMAQPSRPPRAPGSGARGLEQHQQQQQEEHVEQQQHKKQGGEFTPWALPKGAQFESRSGACSPNTMRFLGNLLFEEDDSFVHGNQNVTRRASQKTSDSGASDQREVSAESWSSSYVFNSEHLGDIPSRVPRSSMGRGRRGKNDSSNRRARQDRQAQSRINEDHGYPVASFFPYAQQPKPVPVRSMQPAASIGNPFLPSGSFDGSRVAYPRNDSGSAQFHFQQQHQQQHQQQQLQEAAQPRFFNFGGAFAPPTKDGGVGFRPPASAPPTDQGLGMGGNTFRGQPQLRGQRQHYQSRSSPNFAEGGQRQHYQTRAASPTFGGSSAPPGGFQSQSFQPLPHVAGATRDSPFQHTFPSPTPGFTTTAGSPPPYGYSGPGYGVPVAYTQHPHVTGMQVTPTNDFFQIAPQESRSNASHFHPPPPPGWSGPPPPPPGQYAPGSQGTWPSTSAGWPVGDYGYSIHTVAPQGVDSRVGLSPVPQLASSSWTERESEFPPQPSPSVFAAAPPAQPGAKDHPVPVSASPVLSGVPQTSRREQQGPQQARQKSNRKTQPRRVSKQYKLERAKKGELSAPTQAHPRKSTPVNTSSTASSGTATAPKKKKSSRGRDSQTPEASGTASASACSTPSNVPPSGVDVGDESAVTRTVTSTKDQEQAAKKAALIESPATRSAFKDFYRRFRSEERTSFQGAEGFALQSLQDGALPEKVHWRVYLELADLAKRSNRFARARQLYDYVCDLQPFASQGWLEYSKLEEECGDLSRGADILHEGLEYCEYNENLLTRAIKHEEKMGNIGSARVLLARLKHVGIEKVWRTVLEGALMEARAGNVVIARRVLKYLMHNVPWYGPLYLEAYRLERDLGHTDDALRIVKRGLEAIPRYGPLWFGAFRLCEEIDTRAKNYDLPQTIAMIDRAALSISKELIWKVHLDAAQMLERAALHQLASVEDDQEQDADQSPRILGNCRKRFAMTILNCPPNLRWKVWLAAGRMEIGAGNTDIARRLFLRAHKVVPEKGRATTLLECARLEEFTGDFELARAVLCRSRVDYGSDWKVWLESVLLEIRRGDHARAIELAKGALEIHPGTGRLWAALVQLRFFEGGEEAQFSSLRQALNAVPKSGEVWCEGGRIHLNPFSRTFNLKRARRHLQFATKFTPQYGDSFLESLRLELLEQWILPIADLVWEASKSHILGQDESDFDCQLQSYVFDLFAWLVSVCAEDQQSEDEAATGSILGGLLDSDTATLIRERLTPSYRNDSLNLSDLELRCANADPNYGLLWFHCRHGPIDTARRILARALDKVMTELCTFVPIYIAAIIRYSAVTGMSVQKRELKAEEDSKVVLPPLDDAGWEKFLDESLLAAPPLVDIIKNTNVDGSVEKGVVFLENSIAESTFATGLAELNKNRPLDSLSLNERRKALFGTDALFS